MNTHTNLDSSDGLLADLEAQIAVIEAASSDPMEQLIQYCELVEAITGRGLDIKAGETKSEVNCMDNPDAAREALQHLLQSFDTTYQAIPETERDRTMDQVFKAYRSIAADSLDALDAPVDVLPFKPQPSISYELDLGEKPLNGAAFEDKLLYPRGQTVWRPSEAQIRHMPRLSEDDAYAEAMLKNPYRNKPWDPGSMWLADMQFLIAQEMGLDKHPVVIADSCVIPVPCIGLSADIFYGVDCFIIFRDPEGKFESIVTIDISLDPLGKFVKGFKADILYTPNGAYLHPDLPLENMDYSDRHSRKIDAPRVNDRRTKVGKAMAKIIQCRAEKNLPVFRFPHEKHMSISAAQHRANTSLRGVLAHQRNERNKIS